MTSDPQAPFTSTTPPPDQPATPRPRFRAIYSLLAVACCATIAETMLKMGANATAKQVQDAAFSFGFSALPSWYTIVGILFHIAGFGAWLYTLRSVPLALAFNFTTVQQVTVALAAWLVLREHLPWERCLGLALVVAGVLLLVPAIVNAEHRTEQEGEA